MTQPEKGSTTASSEDVLTAFLTEAAEVEPCRLSSPAQLLWRAEVLARLETEERRALGALVPLLVAVAVTVAVGVTGLTLALAGAGGGSATAVWLGASPLRLLGFGIATLVAVLVFFTRLPRPDAVSSRLSDRCGTNLQR